MFSGTVRRAIPRRATAAIAALLFAMSIVAAQDPAPAPAQTPDGQAPSGDAQRVQELEARLKEIDEAIRRNELRLLEAQERTRRQLAEAEEIETLQLFLLVMTGNNYLIKGEEIPRGDGPDLHSAWATRNALSAQRNEVAGELEAKKRELEAKKSGSALSFIDDKDTERALGLGTNEPVAKDAAPAEEAAPSQTASPPPAAAPPPSNVHVTTPIAAMPMLASLLSSVANTTLESAADTGADGITVFATGQPPPDGTVDAWVEVRLPRLEFSGGVHLDDSGDGYNFAGTSGDLTAVVKGELRVPYASFADQFARGTAQVRIVTAKGLNEFHGSATLYTTPSRNLTWDATRKGVPAPSLDLRSRSFGGPVIRDKRFLLFDRTGREVGEGTGSWTYNGGSALTFNSIPTREARLEVTLDHETDEAFGTFVPDAGSGIAGTAQSVSFRVPDLYYRAPPLWLEAPAGSPGPGRADPETLATRVARYYGVSGGTSGTGAAAVDPYTQRLGFGDRTGAFLPHGSQPDWRNPIDPRLANHSIVNALRGDARTQFVGVRLISPTQAARLVLASLTHAAHAQPAELPVIFFRSLGKSTGPDAIEMTYVSGTPLPSGLDNLLVLEPVAPEEGRKIEKQIALASRGAAAVVKLTMYCLNQRLATPAPGQIMRLASAAAHEKFRHVLPIWDAADKARADGALRPDSDPDEYYHSIVQWAIWTKEQGFDERAFGRAFAEHTRKNLETAGHKWSPQVEGVVRGIVPNRWNDIRKVLDGAGL